jgi:hypothetical protein
MEQFDFSKKLGKKRIKEFADVMLGIQGQIDFKVSARGWCYLMEQAGYINKSQFDKVEFAINRCRKDGLLPVDFVAEEVGRAFEGVEIPNIETTSPELKDVLRERLQSVLQGGWYYTPDWWEDEEFYIQMVVEKVDLKTLGAKICDDYHIPIANARGWQSIYQRAEYARRFKQAEDKGLQPVLLYCGDHDPDGLRISDTIRKNLEDIKDVRWDDGEGGYDPENLVIHRFGLNYDFIIKNKYTWIDNLYTGSGGQLALMKGGKVVQGVNKWGQPHKNFKLPYLQEYLNKVGVRKCEANAIVTTPDKAEELFRGEIERWLGKGARERFALKRKEVRDEYDELLKKSKLESPIKKFLGK